MLAPLACSNQAGDGEDSGTGTGETGETTDPGPSDEAGVGEMGARRLSRNEYDNTVRDLLGDDTRPGTKYLPEDIVDPFDNDFRGQQPSKVLIDALEASANDIAVRLVADPVRRAEVVGCEPTGADDAGCMTSFIEHFGRLAVRRPLSAEEVGLYLALAQTFALDQGDFYQGVEVVLRAMLQTPEFVYRIERGTPTATPGVFRLDDFEVATRLAYFLWGSAPNDELLEFAEAGELGTPEAVAAVAEWMLSEDRARARVDRFHAMWLGYFQLPHQADVTASMREESRALIERVIFDEHSAWQELFTADGTYINQTLADLYGLPAPAGDEFAWVDYGDSGRQGLLSHGSFLSVAGKFGDTSPTQRGKLIRNRLLCQVIPPPPPDVNVDEPPSSPDSDCKWDAYAAHRELAGCKGCHDLMDPVGFGLENYDQLGRWRETDVDHPECVIAGEGTIDGDAFSGPAGLADYLVTGEQLEICIVRQVYRFAMGHEVLTEDVAFVDQLDQSFAAADYRFDRLMLDLVSDEAFLYRREEETLP